MLDWNNLYASRMSRVVASDIREKMKLLGARQIIQLGGGLPDPAIFPYDRIAEATTAILSDKARAKTALQYASSEGHMPLREWLVGYMKSLGVECGVENILITNGSQQGLDFVGKLLLSPGDVAMVEMPSFIGALRAFDVYEPRYVGLPNDSAEWDAAKLEPAKFCYVGTDFRNPTGTAMTLEERHKLLDVMEALGTPILEDGCYEKLRYDGEDIPSLLALSVQRNGGIENSGVIYTSTFSKTIAPSMRVGWTVGPAAVIRKLTLIKQGADLATSALNQMILVDVVGQHLDEAVQTARTMYRARRDSMLRAMDEYFPDGMTWTRPEGGLYVWIELPEGVDGDEFAMRALTDKNVSVISGTSFYPQNAMRNTLRLSFSLATEEDAREGIRRLGELAREMTGQRVSEPA